MPLCPPSVAEWAEKQDVSVEVWSRDGRCVFVNNAWRQLWKMPDQVLVGSDYSILADDGLHAKPVWQVLQYGFRGPDSVATETPPSFYDPEMEDGRPGRSRWTEGFVAPLWTGSDAADEAGPAPGSPP